MSEVDRRASEQCDQAYPELKSERVDLVRLVDTDLSDENDMDNFLSGMSLEVDLTPQRHSYSMLTSRTLTLDLRTNGLYAFICS